MSYPPDPPPPGYPPQTPGGYPPQAPGGYPPQNPGYGHPPPPYGAPRAKSSTGLIIAIIVLLILIGTAAALYFTGMFDKWFGRGATPPAYTANQPVAPMAPAPVTPAPYTPAAPVAPAAGGVTDEWLRGTWQESCASPEFMRIEPSTASVTFHTGPASYVRSGDTLTITGTGSIQMTVGYLSQDQMMATLQGDSTTLQRCG